MRNPKKINRIAGLADMQQRDLAQSLASAIRKQAAHTQQIDELKRYRLDYAAPLSNGSLNGANAQQIVGFISNLNSAIRSLESQIPELTTAVSDAEGAWLAAQSRAKAFNNLAQKSVSAEQQVLESRQERNLEDAWLAQHSTRK